MAIKKFDFEKGELIGKSGRVYKVDKSIAVGRWPEYLKWEQLFYFGMTASESFRILGEVFELLNKSKPAQAAVLIDKVREKVALIADRKKESSFMLVALVLNYDGEDTSKFIESDINAKIEDWGEYDSNDFFQFAANLVPQFINDYNEILLKSLAKTPKTLNPLGKNTKKT